MASFNSLSFSPVVGCYEKSPSKPYIRYLSVMVGEGELVETNFKNRNCDPLHVNNEHVNLTNDNLIDVRECQHGEGCQKQATFGNTDDNIPTFCVKHALRGSVFVKRGYCRCQSVSCYKRHPNFPFRHLLRSLRVRTQTCRRMFQIRFVWAVFAFWAIVLQETQSAPSGEREGVCDGKSSRKMTAFALLFQVPVQTNRLMCLTQGLVSIHWVSNRSPEPLRDRLPN
jgi:hypothetical protein